MKRGLLRLETSGFAEMGLCTCLRWGERGDVLYDRALGADTIW